MKPKPERHLLVRYETAPGKGYAFIGYCDYTSCDKREFVDPTTQKIPANLCEKCREKLTKGSP